MSWKESARARLRRAGWDVSRFPNRYNPEAQILAALDAYDIDSVIDVGANDGTFAASLRALGYQGRITSFEPSPDVFTQLSENAANDARWDVHNLALGEARGEMTLNVSAGSEMSSLLDINDNFLSRSHRGVVTGATSVKVEILDDVGITGERIFIKTDTQGYDVRVLRGASRTLLKTHCLFMELSLIPNYEGIDNEWRTAIDFVAERGFEPAGFFAIGRDSRRRLREMDGLFVRASAHPNSA